MTSDNFVPYRPTGSLNLPINYFCKRQKAENLLHRTEINFKKVVFTVIIVRIVLNLILTQKNLKKVVFGHLINI